MSHRQHAIAQLAHVELLTPKPQESLDFFTKLLGMQVTESEGQSVYLRGYEDFYHHSLKLTEAPEPGLGHLGWRTVSPDALEERAAALTNTEYGLGWTEDSIGHGRAYAFVDADGHRGELFWEVEYFTCPKALKSPLVNRPQARPIQGVPVRRLDHVNLMCADVTPNKKFYEDLLTFRTRERIQMDDGMEMGAWMSVSILAHEVALMRDMTGSRGRFHHVAFWYGIPQHLSDAAEILAEAGVQIEAGPGKHGITQALFMYVFEPGGNRVELFGDSGYLILDPDWKTVTWEEKDLELGVVVYGSKLPDTYFTYGTPVVEVPATFDDAAQNLPAPVVS